MARADDTEVTTVQRSCLSNRSFEHPDEGELTLRLVAVRYPILDEPKDRTHFGVR